MDYERGVAFSERQGHQEARNELGAVLAGDLGTAGLQRACRGQRHAYRRLVVFTDYPGVECLEDFLCACQRTPEKGLLACEMYRALTELGHERNHHPGEQARLSYVESIFVCAHAAEVCSYTLDGQ